MSVEVVLAPASPYQERYLNSDADITIAGGAVGASKSYIGLMRHLRWAEDPYYRGYCVRKNAVTLMKTGGLFEKAVDMYRRYDPKIKVRLQKKEIEFSSGAIVSFAQYDKDGDSEKFRGLEISACFYDEGTDAKEEHIWMLISRLRTTLAKLKPNIWITCNPDPDSWLLEFVEWYLYPEGHEKAGLPDPKKNGKIRWLHRVNGQKVWADTREELIDLYGKKDLDYDDPKQIKPLSVRVMLGTIYDNPVLIESDPSYLTKLEALPAVKKNRELHGNWYAREEGSTYFERGWVEEILDISGYQIANTVRCFDFAGTLKSDLNISPDYTASVLMSKTVDSFYIIRDIQRTRIKYGEWKTFILDCARYDPQGTLYYIPQDPNPAAKKAAELLIRELIEVGLEARIIRASSSKLDRFRPFSAMAMNGGVKILKGCGSDHENEEFDSNKFYYKELEAFTGKRKSGEMGHDDLVDCSSDAFSVLASKVNLNGLFSGLMNFNSLIN